MTERSDAEMRAEMQHERETRVRTMNIRRPDDRASPFSGGVEIEIMTNVQNATVIDTNPIELRAWAEKMLRFSKRLEGIETCPACVNPNWSHFEHESECER